MCNLVIPLEPVFHRFCCRVEALEEIFTDWCVNAPPSLREPDIMFLEGLVSSLWQHWSLFCRRVIISSALGCITRTGKSYSACVTPESWMRVSYISWRVHSRGRINPHEENSDLKKEPTWGDVQKIQDVINTISPGNSGTLRTTLGSVSGGPIHVQLVRNASSHRNSQTYNRVLDLRVSYVTTKRICHPVESALWTDPLSSDYAFIAWKEQMRLIADLMTL